MNKEVFRAKLVSIRADIDAALAELEDAPKPRAAEPSPEWMRIADYCATRGLSRRTLHGMIADGLPTVGEGKRRRIVVSKADEWIAGPKGRRAANG